MKSENDLVKATSSFKEDEIDCSRSPMNHRRQVMLLSMHMSLKFEIVSIISDINAIVPRTLVHQFALKDALRCLDVAM